MKLLQDKSDMTQRELAQKFGISLGGLNFSLNPLIYNGWTKTHSSGESKNMLGHAYLLTRADIAEKALLTARFLKRRMLKYQELRVEFEMQKIEVTQYDSTSKNPCIK